MRDWVKNWVLGQRNKGVRGLEVKELAGNFYVYKSTTYWDKQLKKRRKKSSYLGVLDREKGLVERKRIVRPRIRGVWEYGNMALLDWSMGDLPRVLDDAFGELWKEVYALALVRVLGHTPLKRVQSVWERLYNVRGIEPDLSPGRLSRLLKFIGANRNAQKCVFEALSGDKELVYDLSCVFTRSTTVSFAEQGYNKDHLYLPQVNLALFCGRDSGLPTRVRMLPGSVRDAKSLYTSMDELDVEGAILVLDRGFFSNETIDYLSGKRISYVVPAKRNSKLYDTRVELDEHFFYHDRLIKTGKQKMENNNNLYLFEDQDLLLDETKTLYKRLDGGLKEEKFKGHMGRAGRILVVSNLDLPGKDLFEYYKSRDRIEKLFDTYKNTLEADKLYLRDNETVFGHTFIGFLSLYAYTRIELLLKKTGLSDKYTAKDLLEEYSKIYLVDLENQKQLTEIPKTAQTIDQKTGLNLFPKHRS